MSFASYKKPQRKFPLGSGKGQSAVTLSGLSLADIGVLLHTHFDDIEALFDLFFAGKEITDDHFKAIAPVLIMQAPGLVANIIATAAGVPEEAPMVEKLSGPLQIEMFITVGDLTFTEVGGVKKFLESVSGLLQAVKMTRQKKAPTVTKPTTTRR